MFKKLSFFALVALAAVSCNNKESRMDRFVPVTVHVNDFLVTVDTFSDTKAPESAADYTGVKAIVLAFYDGETEIYKSEQVKSLSTEQNPFGEFTCSLPLGTYTMVVLGYGKDMEDEIKLISPTLATYDCPHPRETFAATKTVTISGTSANNVEATLSRIVSKLQVASSDPRPSSAAKIRYTFTAGGKSFNPTTGFATVNNGFSNTVGISANPGTTSSSVCYLFLTSEEATMDVTIEVLDESDNVINRKVVTNVPFRLNRCTKLTGSIYSASTSASSFLLEPEWLETQEINF